MTHAAAREASRFGLFVFAQDVLDVGADALADQAAAMGISRLILAITYHHGRDLLPHDPRRRLTYHEGGVAYFQPSEGYGTLRPTRSRLARHDPAGQLRRATAARGMALEGWLILLHDSRLGERHPRLTQEPAVGGSLHHALCPAQPEVARYARHLVTDAAGLGIDAVWLESLHFAGFEHGSHHERALTPLDPFRTFLLGICFCPACRANGTAAGVDVSRLRREVAAEIEAGFASPDAVRRDVPGEPSSLGMGPDLERYLAAARDAVTRLVEGVASAARAANPRLRLIHEDPAAAALGYATGVPATPARAASLGWQSGIDLRGVAQQVDGLGIAGYFADPVRLIDELRAFGAAGAGPLDVVLRPMPPHTTSVEGLDRIVADVEGLGIGSIAFYHYALMPRWSLDWITVATSRSRARSGERT